MSSADIYDAATTLALEHVSRHLAGRVVVRDLNLAVFPGEVLGLLGVNGAGKSTTLRMIAGVLVPSSGIVRFGGADLREHPERARRGIGYLPETPPLQDELTANEFLRFCARLHGLDGNAATAAVARAIDRCELGPVHQRPMATLSKGFRQRVGLAQAIVHEPELVVLDEPSSGLDPVQALKLRELVRSLGRDCAVVLSTHVLPDVVACCDRVAILHQGEMRHVGVLAQSTKESVLRVSVVKLLTVDHWLALAVVATATPIDANQWRVRLIPGVDVSAFASAVVERGFGLVELRAEGSALEQTFLAIAAQAEEQAA